MVGKMTAAVVVLIFILLAAFFYIRNRANKIHANQSPSATVVHVDSSAKKNQPPPMAINAQKQDTSMKMVEGNAKTTNKKNVRLSKKKAAESSMAMNTQDVQTQHTQSEMPPKTDMSNVEGGNYTIYIGSFKQKALADDEAGRWKEAGYPSYVTQNGVWYRVSLGKYTSKEEAHTDAEKLKEAFESGYRIGLLK
jgi:cell division protein FtsN